MKRLAPVLTLFVLAPLIGEFLLGSTPVDKIGELIILAPLYGGGALLIREIARRRGRGWPTIFLLALAYGVVEEGLITQSLFNREYAHIPDLLTYGHGVVWAIFVLSLHTIWSISAPIALTELIFPARRARPWLTGWSIVLFAALWVGAAVVIRFGTSRAYPDFHATATQSLAALAAAAVLVLAALAAPVPGLDGRRAPAPGRVLLTGLAIGAAFLGVRILAPRHVHLPWLIPVLVDAVLLVVLLATLARWSHRRGWGARHTLAVTAAALLTYAWFGYQVVSAHAVDYAGQTLAAAAVCVGLVLLARRYRATRPRKQVSIPATAGNPSA